MVHIEQRWDIQQRRSSLSQLWNSFLWCFSCFDWEKVLIFSPCWEWSLSRVLIRPFGHGLMFGHCWKWKFWWGLLGRWQLCASLPSSSSSTSSTPARRSSSSLTCRGWSRVSSTCFSPQLVYLTFPSPGTAKKICAGTPRITRGMGTNITLEPGERVRDFYEKLFSSEISCHLCFWKTLKN